MTRYSFETTWDVHAPIEAVWEEIAHPLAWPSWWKGVSAVEELEAGDDEGSGALHRYTWKSALPYRLGFDMRVTLVERPVRLEGEASGELSGSGVWMLTEREGGTTVRYAWEIETTRPWMNLAAPLLRPAFEWNHDWVMNSGARGLSQRLGVPVSAGDGERRGARPWRGLGVALGAVLALAVLLCWRRNRR